MNMETSLDHSLESFFQKHLRDKRTVACAWGFGIFAVISYLYVMTNNLQNYDSIYALPKGYGSGVTSGRWFLSVLGQLMARRDWTYNIPFFNILFALIWLGIAAVLVVHILNIQHTGICFCIGAVTASFPAIGAAMFFTFTVQFYLFAILLGTAGVLLALRKRWYRIFSSLLFALSLGIYQAYYPFIAALFVLVLIREAMDPELSWQTVLKNAFLYLGLFVFGFVLYSLFSKVILAILGLQLTDYQGLDTMGKLELQAIPQMLRDIYSNFFLLCTRDYCSVSATTVVQRGILAGFVVSGLCLIAGWKSRPLMKNLELCVLLLLLPVAANGIIIMASSGYIYTLMVCGLLALYYLPLLMVDQLKPSVKAKKALASVICLVTFLVSLNYSYQNNGNYIALYYQNQKVENYYAVMLARAKSLEGYRDDMDIAFIGYDIFDKSIRDGWDETIFQYTGKDYHVTSAINAYSRPDFIYNYFGFEIRHITNEEALDNADVIAGMDYYPNSGSIKIIDNTVFIKCRPYSHD